MAFSGFLFVTWCRHSEIKGTGVSIMLQLCEPTQISDAKNSSNHLMAGQEQLISPHSSLFTVQLMTS